MNTTPDRIDERANNVAAPKPPARDELRAQAKRIGWQAPALLDGTDNDPFFDRVRDITCDIWHAN